MEETFQTNSWDPPTPAPPFQEAPVRKVAGKRANLTAKQRKARDVRPRIACRRALLNHNQQAAVEEVVQRLPIEFRGNDPVYTLFGNVRSSVLIEFLQELRKSAEGVIIALMDARRPLRSRELIPFLSLRSHSDWIYQ